MRGLRASVEAHARWASHQDDDDPSIVSDEGGNVLVLGGIGWSF
jgi:hypothetical protein